MSYLWLTAFFSKNAACNGWAPAKELQKTALVTVTNTLSVIIQFKLATTNWYSEMLKEAHLLGCVAKLLLVNLFDFISSLLDLLSFGRSTHFVHQPHKFTKFWMIRRDHPPNAGGHFYISTYQIQVQAAANSLVVWQSADIHGTSIARPQITWGRVKTSCRSCGYLGTPLLYRLLWTLSVLFR